MLKMSLNEKMFLAWTVIRIKNYLGSDRLRCEMSMSISEFIVRELLGPR